MNKDEAKKILASYRPGIDDATDEETKQALIVMENDPELRRWHELHQREQAEFRATLRGITPPDDLKRDILLAHERFVIGRRRSAWIASAAAAVLMLSAMSFALFSFRTEEDRSFANFRDRVVATAIREYRMDIESGDPIEVQEFLDQQGSAVRLPVTQALGATPLFGAGHLSWKGNPVTMVCFKTESDEILFLFSVDREAVTGAPDAEAILSKLSRLNVISWAQDGNVFVLAGAIDPEQLRALL